MLDVAWDVDTGGSQLDLLIAEHLALKFNAEVGGGDDVRKHPKAMAKLKKQVGLLLAAGSALRRHLNAGHVGRRVDA